MELLFSQAEQKGQRRGRQLAVATLCSTAAQLGVPLVLGALMTDPAVAAEWPVL